MRRTDPKGFSLIEVLVAVLVSSIGFAAIFALQVRTMQGNISSREQSAAMVLAESGLETLRAESYRWRTAELPDDGLLNVDPSQWHTLTPSPVDHSGLPLAFGAAAGSNLSRQRFCMHYWFQELTGAYEQMLNVRVRVIWPRNPADTTGLAGACREAGALAFAENPALWNTLTLPGVLRMRE